MSHYVSANLIASPPKLICQLAGCNIAIPAEPYPPPFSLLKAATAEVSPSERDVMRFFCSQEHRDQCWKSEKGWFDRRVAMPSDRAMKGPTAWDVHASNGNVSHPHGTHPNGNHYGAQYQAPWARYGPPTAPSPSTLATANRVVDTQLPAMRGQGAATPQVGWAPGYGYLCHGPVRR